MAKPSEELLNRLNEMYVDEYITFEEFTDAVNNYFSRNKQVRRFVHSTKYRLKDPDHLRDKINRKWDESNPITEENFFKKITDLSGVRVLLLKQSDFSAVHQEIQRRIEKGDWVLHETPTAYTWDPETRKTFESFNYFNVKEKASYYTSVHYLVRPRAESPVCCEIQVRTLLEEVWGEVDHTVNYPHSCNSGYCKPQLLALAKFVGAGSRLVDSIFESHSLHPSNAASDRVLCDQDGQTHSAQTAVAKAAS